MYTPMNFDQINLIEGSYTPSAVKYENNETFNYWVRSLFQRALSSFVFETPDEWEGSTRDFFLHCLFRIGYVGIFYNSKYGYMWQPGTLKDYNVYYQFTTFHVNNAYDKSISKDYKIGRDCEILKSTPDFRGLWDIVIRYAEMLSTLDNAINMSLINNKFAFILGAKNKQSAEALKKMLDKINQGDPAVIFDMLITDDPKSKDLPFTFWDRDLKKSYLTSDQLTDLQTILCQFDSEVGISTLPYQEKKERLNVAETESKKTDCKARATVWLECMQSCIEKIKKLYPDIKLSVMLRSDLEESEPEPQKEGEVIE